MVARGILLLIVGTLGALAALPPTGGAALPPQNATIVLDSFSANPASQIIELAFPAASPNVVTWVRPAGVLSAHFLASRDPLGITPEGACFSFIIGLGGATQTVNIDRDCWAKNHMEVQWHCMFHTGVNGVFRLADDDQAVGQAYALDSIRSVRAGPNAINPAQTLRVTAAVGDVTVTFQNGALVTQTTGTALVPAGTVVDLAVPPGAEPTPTTQFVLNRASGALVSTGLFQRL